LTNATLDSWNKASADDAIEAMIACCGARRWAAIMVASRPIESVEELMAAANSVWDTMEEPDWLQAFACHPRIGQRQAIHGSLKSAEWSQQEQSTTMAAQDSVLAELTHGNKEYEERFGFTYIVCATGKTAEEMLDLLNRRLDGDRATELRQAAEQQRLITQIRLRKWLAQ